MNNALRGCLAAAALVVVARSADAAVIYTGAAINENFDSLPTSSASGFFPDTVGAPTDVPGSTGWVATRLGGTGTTMNYTNYFSTTTTSTGSVVGAATMSSDTERALGTLTSSSHTPAIGVEIVNGTGLDIVSVTVSFMQEHWRTPGSSASAGNNNGFPNMTPAEFGTTDSGVTSATIFTDAIGYTNVAALDLVSANPTATAGAIDGNLVENRVLRMATIDFSANPIGAGESFFLRFNDIDESGTDGIMAVDDFTFTAETVPEPATWALAAVGLAGLAGVGLRRSRLPCNA